MSTPTELRKTILKDAPKFIEAYMGVAMGRGVMTCTDKKIRDEVWDLLKQMVAHADDTMSIQAQTSKEIIQAVTEGKLTTTEAKELMALLQTQQEIEELPKIREALEQLKADED